VVVVDSLVREETDLQTEKKEAVEALVEVVVAFHQEEEGGLQGIRMILHHLAECQETLKNRREKEDLQWAVETDMKTALIGVLHLLDQALSLLDQETPTIQRCPETQGDRWTDLVHHAAASEKRNIARVQEIIHQLKAITCHQELTVHQEIQEENQDSVHTEVASEMLVIEMEASADQLLGSTHLLEWQTTAARDHQETHLGTPPGNTLHQGAGVQRLSGIWLQEKGMFPVTMRMELSHTLPVTGLGEWVGKENILGVDFLPEREVLWEAQGNTVEAEEEVVELPVVEGEAEMMTGVGAAAS